MLENPGWELGQELPQGWKQVQQTELPEFGPNEIPYEDFPKEIAGTWTQQWSVREMTQEELDRKVAPETAKSKLLELGLNEAEIQALALGLIR